MQRCELIYTPGPPVHSIQTAPNALPADASAAVFAPFAPQESSPLPAPVSMKPGSLRSFEVLESMMLTAGKLRNTPEGPASAAGAHMSSHACAQPYCMPASRSQSLQPGIPSMSLADVPAARRPPGDRGCQRSAAPPKAQRMKRRSRAAAYRHARGTGSKASQPADGSRSTAAQRAKPARTWPGPLLTIQHFIAAEEAMCSAMHDSEGGPCS